MLGNKDRTRGFTIIEVLTAVAIVAIMVSILIPAVSKIHKLARNVRQRSQLTAISIGLEAFRNDFGDYPDSSELDTNGDIYNGGQKLAEAMVGLDYLGFHPDSGFNVNGKNKVYGKDGNLINVEIYSADKDTPNWQTKEENLAARKGPYLEPEKANAVRVGDIYGTTGTPGKYNTYSDFENSLVLADQFPKKNSNYAVAMEELGSSQNKIGMPILYFKANTSKIQQRDATNPNNPAADDRIYLGRDNKDLFGRYVWDNAPAESDLPDGALLKDSVLNLDRFANMIINPKLRVGDREMPYNSRSYILVSAGDDGIYGTEDDIFNFDKK